MRLANTDREQVRRARDLSGPPDNVNLTDAGLRGPGFVLVPNQGAVAESACVLERFAGELLADVVERVSAAQGLDPQIAVVLTTDQLACGSLFYTAIANDVSGIGYQHQDPRELFDDSPESRLEGIAFLNDWPYWQRNQEEFAKAFNHEIGHRWGARVSTLKGGASSRVLLGRQELHWSYFLDNGGSPLEGNAWTSSAETTFVADTPFARRAFSGLDLYLMGVLSPEEVPNERLITSPTQTPDCLNVQVNASSPPQSCAPMTLQGEAQPVDVNAIIGAEGPRIPAPDPTPRVVDIAVVVLGADARPIESAACEALSASLEARIAEFSQATRGRIILKNLTAFAVSCSDSVSKPVATQRSAAKDSGCAIVPQPRGTGSSWPLVASLLWWLRSRGRRLRGRQIRRGAWRRRVSA